MIAERLVQVLDYIFKFLLSSLSEEIHYKMLKIFGMQIYYEGRKNDDFLNFLRIFGKWSGMEREAQEGILR